MEDLPIFGPQGDVEVIINRKAVGKGKCGARIVLTKDNFGSRGTGFGGTGGTMCEAIDIVAGSLSCDTKLRNSKTLSRGNFASDGARIYLTERGNIQKYFTTAVGSEPISMSSEGKSGIGIKADHTLVIGRERVRILVGFGNSHGGERLVNQNSNINPKIELARINSTDSQPAVLGDSLAEYLRVLRKELRDLRQYVLDLHADLWDYKVLMAEHIHESFGLIKVATPSSEQCVDELEPALISYMDAIKDIATATTNSQTEAMKALGLESGNVEGTDEKRILSSTVYIGK